MPISRRVPAAGALLAALPVSGVGLLLLAVAVLLKALQSLGSYRSSLSVGYFSARCTALVKSRIHSQVLAFSFPCASGYKVGNLTNYAGSGPQAVETQINAIGGLLMELLLVVLRVVA